MFKARWNVEKSDQSVLHIRNLTYTVGFHRK